MKKHLAATGFGRTITIRHEGASETPLMRLASIKSGGSLPLIIVKDTPHFREVLACPKDTQGNDPEMRFRRMLYPHIENMLAHDGSVCSQFSFVEAILLVLNDLKKASSEHSGDDIRIYGQVGPRLAYSFVNEVELQVHPHTSDRAPDHPEEMNVLMSMEYGGPVKAVKLKKIRSIPEKELSQEALREHFLGDVTTLIEEVLGLESSADIPSDISWIRKHERY